ncbi:MAG TPA: hypothetical protein VK202_06505 [Bacteroidia bacterium]|nr:hypothetical protein [Bacteroidia bacterium]
MLRSAAITADHTNTIITSILMKTNVAVLSLSMLQKKEVHLKV